MSKPRIRMIRQQYWVCYQRYADRGLIRGVGSTMEKAYKTFTIFRDTTVDIAIPIKSYSDDWKPRGVE